MAVCLNQNGGVDGNDDVLKVCVCVYLCICVYLCMWVFNLTLGYKICFAASFYQQ